MGCAGAINPLLYDFCVPPTHGMYNNTPLIAQQIELAAQRKKKKCNTGQRMLNSVNMKRIKNINKKTKAQL